MQQTLNKFGRWLAITLLLLPLSACAGDAPPAPNSGLTAAQTTGRLSTILSRGQLICGVSGEVPGFSFVDQQGNYAGLDVDICRAIAAALFNDPEAIEFRNLNAKERFTALQTGEIDILSRNTTLTASRDTSIGLKFAPIVFYDGQGVMVRQNQGIQSLKDLGGKSICLQTGTTHEQNLTDQTRKLGIKFTPIVFEDVNTAFATYAEGRCDAISADRSALVSRRTLLPNPDQNLILPTLLSKEPLAPAVVKGDASWQNVVEWVIYATMEAEELGLNAANLNQNLKSQDPTIRRFLGVEGNLGQGLGLSGDFAARIVKHVGNYGEIYDRNLGPKTPLNLDRGLNKLWIKGGLMYSPPFR
ncbi:MAG: amino acid ABC transporter substrate-binding protein [Aphanocapsa sp. GSE-SYN-MK-11-07L]|jgi:general L-amino acid transport system substrate-binding protein|nr:amino acid ABC transporter substrate-binding protein [Aphanocapsa sp. GSE-SYN-MK-11-07L]